MIVTECLLQRMHLFIRRRDAFHGQYFMAVHLHGQHQAGSCRKPIEENRASAAHAVFTAQMRAGEAELLAQEIRQREADLHLLLIFLAVDGDGDSALLAHALPTRVIAATSARRAITAPRC